MKKSIIVLVLHVVIALFLFAVVPDVTEDQFTGTWFVEWERAGEKVEDQVWIVKDSGVMTSYTPEGKEITIFTWEKAAENIWKFYSKSSGRYYTWYTYIIDEKHLRMRNYLDSSEIMELYKISDSQEGFPENIDEYKKNLTVPSE